MWNYYILFLYQLIDIWVVSDFWAIMNNATVSIYMKIFTWTYIFIFPRYIPGVELLYYIVVLCITFRGIVRLFNKAGIPFYIPTSSV